MLYHVNPATGDVGACRAVQGRCPFGSAEEHHPAYEAAAHAAEGRLQELYDFGGFSKASPQPGEASSLIVFSTKSGTKYRLHREQEAGDTWTVERMNADGTRELHTHMVLVDLEPGKGAYLHGAHDITAYIRTSRVATFDSDALNPKLREAEGLSPESPLTEQQKHRSSFGRPSDVPYVRDPRGATVFVLSTSSGDSYRAHRQPGTAGEVLYTVEHFRADGQRAVTPDLRMLSLDITEEAVFADQQGAVIRTDELIALDSDSLTPDLRTRENLEYR